MSEPNTLIMEYRHDKRMPREKEALLILRKVAAIVKPIMQQRLWKVGALVEMYPDNARLLGLNYNGGMKICLRLRHHSDRRRFLVFEEILDTMLHELCHIVHAPHNRQFHALWNQLRDEHEELLRKGFTGEGFYSRGHQLGGNRIPMDEARRRARAAAEKRRTLTKNSGQRLGGQPIWAGQDPRQVRANAAMKRAQILQGCGHGSRGEAGLAEEASNNGFRTQAEEDDANEAAIIQAFIELIQEEEKEKYGSSYVPPSQENPAGPQRNAGSSNSPYEGSSSQKPAFMNSPGPSSRSNNISYDKPWNCPTCTLENPATFLCCDVCTAERPIPLSGAEGSSRETPAATEKPGKKRQIDTIEIQDDPPPRDNFSFKNRERATDMIKKLDYNINKRALGWLCACGTFMETEWWTCSACGKMKPSS